MSPRQVCTVCGEARRRITRVAQVDTGRTTNGSKPRDRAESFAGTTYATRTETQVTTLGWSDCGHNNYRPGVVLDPFAGSGTTAVAAALTGRDAVLIDLDARNVDLCRRRLNETMLIVNETTDGDVTTWTVRHDMPGTKGEHPDQLNLFTA